MSAGPRNISVESLGAWPLIGQRPNLRNESIAPRVKNDAILERYRPTVRFSLIGPERW